MNHYRYRVTVIRPDGSSGAAVVLWAMDGRQAIAFAALERRRLARRPKPLFLAEHARSVIAERVGT